MRLARASKGSARLSVGVKSDTLFPTTHATWITLQLDAIERGGRDGSEPALRELRDHVMRRYYEPLSAYLAATGYRDVDAPSALVAGYFVERFADSENLGRWRASGLPLRRWLMNGLLLWVRGELRRRLAQAGREAALPPEIVAQLRRLADALESGCKFEVRVAGKRVYVPARAEFSIEHERAGDDEELEFQLRWSAAR